MNNDNRLFLLDAYALIFRAYYAFIKNPRINSKNLNTSAIFGFTNSLLELIKKEKPTHIAVCFDVGGKTFRHEDYTEYKANREETPEAIKVAVPYIQQIIKAMHIPIIGMEGYEADDVIGTLAKKAEQNGYKTYMVTPDKDFAQLVSENIFMYKPSSRGNDIEILGVNEVKQKYEVENPSQVIDLLGMMGDSVDNIPGLPGVGEKTAKKFIKEFGSLENLLENTNQLKGKMKEKVEENKELGLLSKKLATINTEVPIDFEPEKLTLDSPNWEEIQSLFQELEFRRTYENIQKIFLQETTESAKKIEKKDASNAQLSLFDAVSEESTTEQAETIQNLEKTPHLYQLVNDEFALSLMIKTLQSKPWICFDTETDSLDEINAKLVGIAFSYEKNKGYYVPFSENNEENKVKIDSLKELFHNENIKKIGHNLKFDTKVLKKYDLEPKGELFDTMLAHYLIQPNSRHGLDVLAENYLNYSTIKFDDLFEGIPKKNQNFKNIELEKQKEYAVEDTDITLQLKEIFSIKLKETNTYSIFKEIESPLMSVLADMEYQGIALDTSVLDLMSSELNEDLINLEKQIFEITGKEFNLNSPKQLGDILFEDLKIDSKAKKTKTGQYQTSESVLLKLQSKHPIIDLILQYRQIQKLKSTYVDSLPKEINPTTNRVHTTFAQAVAQTGRLASNNPNLQNIPIKTERGREIRKAFIAKDENHVLVAADYSQIELRLIAEMSNEIAMKNDFINGMDIHSSTASKLFDVSIDEVTREQRSQAKTVNFGIIYGVSSFGLSEQTGLSRKESKELIDAYFETYPNLKLFMEKQVEFAREHGYVETLLGRRRYLQDIHSANAIVRSHAERNAVNAPVQGTAADIIKIAMIKLFDRLNAEKLKTKMLLQVHDELIFEVPKEELEIIKPIIKSEMENAYKTEVPLVVEIGAGKNWLEAH
ncbi:MAG: DNA polymerase I [Flavobacteriales bacterium]|nr:DNA polymerase I [Flavobacteriales bacterium]